MKYVVFTIDKLDITPFKMYKLHDDGGFIDDQGDYRGFLAYLGERSKRSKSNTLIIRDPLNGKAT